MTVTQTESMEALEKKGWFAKNESTASELRAVLHDMPSMHKSALGRLLESNNSKSAEDGGSDLMASVQIKAPAWKQIAWLSYRELLNLKRDVQGLFGRFGVTIILNLLVGLIFLGVGKKDSANSNNFANHFGAIFMVTVGSMIGSAQPVMLSFPFERPLFLREYSTGTYSATSYFLSKLVLELPLTLFQSILQYLFAYFMCDFQGSFAYLVLAGWGLGAASASVAVLLGCCLNDVRDVQEMAPLLFIPQFLFSGFFVRTASIPVFLRWAQYLCSVKYSVNLILITEFDASNPSCDGINAQACHDALVKNDVDPQLWWVYMLILLALFVGFRLIAAAVLVRRAQKFY